MKDLPKDLAARISRPVSVLDQLAAVRADFDAAKIEERRAEIMFGKPAAKNGTEPSARVRTALPSLKSVPAKRPSQLPDRPVLAANPVVVNPDAEDARLMPGRGRNPYHLNFTNEWLIVTAHTLAMRCSKQPNGYILDEDQLLLLAESIRKSNLEKMSKGKQPLIVKVPDVKSRAAYRLTTYGASFVNHRMPTGGQNDAQRLNKDYGTYDIGEALALSTIAARLSVPSEPGYWGKGNEGLEPALPLISRYRIAASHTRKFRNPAEALEARTNSLEKWARIPEEKGGLPVVNTNWHLGLMDDEMFSKVHKALLTPIPGKRSVGGVRGEDIVWPASLFVTSHDKAGRAEELIDGVIGAPWIIETDPRTGEPFYNMGFSAIISELHGQTDERTKYVLFKTFKSKLFRSLYVFVPDNTVDVTFERVWEQLLNEKYVPEEHTNWLHVVYYDPLNSGKEEYRGELAPASSRGEKKNHGIG